MPQVNPVIRLGLQDKVLALLLEGKPHTGIARELGITRRAVDSYAKLISNGAQSVRNGGPVKGALRLEISQENALSELSKQIGQYTENYELAISEGDGKAAYAWSTNRIALLREMLKVTGLYAEKVQAPPSEQEALARMSDEEVERRAREILAKRQR